MNEDLWLRLESLLERVGFMAAGSLPLSEAHDPRIEAWLAAGYQGTMTYLERHAEVRAHPQDAFAGYRSAVVVALPYGEVGPPSRDPRVGNISRYALGDDYHEVLKERLHRAADLLAQELPTLATRAFVDAGPLNEKLIASRVGLGWVGKHTNLIRQRHGSYFFLGLLLVSVDLPHPGGVVENRCGTCEACRPACPTGAIVAPYVLDARRCLSYLTIEHRGIFPREFRPALGNRIFGCDDCQEVCPWNRFATRSPLDAFRPREGLRDRTLLEWFSMDLETWRRTFRRSAVRRAKYGGFRRNVLVAMGASGNPAHLSALWAALLEDDPLIRAHAVWAIRFLTDDRGLTDLLVALKSETDDLVRAELTCSLEPQPNT
ncbi:MAG TPA: tRNA epoxyqueuosine(34) reductase QueG [Planctomycetota bacterium]|nr:tRNA epoxyqueuosine(34) reductase QueG [Planctomycetota bacterium]